MALTMWGHLIIQTATPQEDPVQVGTLWSDTSGAATLKICTSVSPYTWVTVPVGAGAGSAPDDAEYIVAAANATLTAERVATDTATVAWDFGTAGQAKANVVDGSITPAKMQDIDSQRVLGRKTAGSGDVEQLTLSEVLDFVGSAAQGDILYRGAATWTRLGAGTSGQFLKTNGAAANPEWATVAAALKTFVEWSPVEAIGTAAAFATIDTRNGHAVLDFAGDVDEETVFSGTLPLTYSGGGLTCELFVAFTSATTGSVRFQAAIERIDLSSLDIDADSFAAFQGAGGSAPGTSGQVIKISITFTDGAQMDSLAAGERFRLKIRRDSDGSTGTDDITTDAEVLGVVLRET